ncbi:dna-3-methyladenine glycosylase ii [Trichoderma cornu-damae]|uniref:Dna-3-methyladenine glycosylase ii n=1 Tax=Trichoderma cornu-damae TaxID=654480 RepID=A0A9P8TYE7_9HYPO|nr:dna-3-methyladenine glycosylase ii [Trichoderma cornu-damae]
MRHLCRARFLTIACRAITYTRRISTVVASAPPAKFSAHHQHAAMAATRRSARISSRAGTREAAEAAESAAAPLPPRERNKRKRTAAPNPQPSAPKTPTKKQRSAAPPSTPTASDAVFGAEGGDVDGTKGTAHKSVTRLADPRFSNATLLSPRTSLIIASRDVESVSPSKAPPAGVRTTTTATLLREACDHLVKVDERLRPLIEKHHCHVFSPEGLAEKIDPFESLASGIISQQVSGAAAKSIKAKFVALFSPGQGPPPQPVDGDSAAEKRFPAPSEVAACPLERLRTAGLSQRKAEYIRGLAEKFASGEITARMLHDAPDEELVEKLIAVRGLGKWSVEMFALFGLKRMDVFSVGDLGIQRGMAAFVGRDVAKLKNKGGKWKYMSEQDMVELSSRFTPYRSLFMWYMWKVEETDVSSMG